MPLTPRDRVQAHLDAASAHRRAMTLYNDLGTPAAWTRGDRHSMKAQTHEQEARRLAVKYNLRNMLYAYSPNEARDDHGKWTAGQLTVNGNEVKEMKRNADMVRFQVWEAGKAMNGIDAMFFFTPFFNEDTGQTISGWDYDSAVDYRGKALPKELLSAIAEAKGLKVR